MIKDYCRCPGCGACDAHTKVKELEAERDALKADAERLDWMEQNPRLGEITTPDGVTTDCFFYAVAGASGVRLRDIIDAARKK